jgi:hypothetical protein
MIIALSGYAQSGKSTSVGMIKELRPWFKQVNFKDGLIAELKKNFANTLRLLSEPYSVDEVFEVKPPHIRALMQEYGTEVRRGDNPNYWTEKWAQAIQGLDNVLVDDCRFLNEAKAVRDNEGIIIRVRRIDQTNTGTHQSETEMDLIAPDYTITTNGKEFHKLEEELVKILILEDEKRK